MNQYYVVGEGYGAPAFAHVASENNELSQSSRRDLNGIEYFFMFFALRSCFFLLCPPKDPLEESRICTQYWPKPFVQRKV